MDDTRRWFNRDPAASQQNSQQQVRLFARADSSPAAEAGIEETKAVESLPPDRHVGIAHQGPSHGERVLIGISIEGNLRLRELSAVEFIESLADRVGKGLSAYAS